MKKAALILFVSATIAASAEVWFPDLGNGRYRNPIIHADYSDPDVVRVGDDFYMTASSFNCVPALPILHSKDLVNWTLINHAVKCLPPFDVFDEPQHGNGVWAPAIRFHEGWFYIFWGDPDFGIYMVKTQDPAGDWEPPHLVQEAKGWIDPCPFWDDDGQAYLSHAFAKSRAGTNSVVMLHRMAPDGSALLDDGVLVFDGHENHPTMEGTKMHKHNGWYYILAPAGGVAEGWQTVLRSKNIYGPYEDRVVLHQGNTDVNGPHQGAWVELENGDNWFVHFQEKQPYGRIIHLQPARWQDDWLMIGEDTNGDGIGEPVAEWEFPNIGKSYPPQVPQTSDEFDEPMLGLQWQWQANPEAAWWSLEEGLLRLHSVPLPESAKNLWDAPSLLLQKMPAEEFVATTKLTFHPQADGEQAGLIVMGRDYALISLVQREGKLLLQQVICRDAEHGRPEKVAESIPLEQQEITLGVEVNPGGVCCFVCSFDGKTYKTMGDTFQAREGKWIGAKVGIFCSCNEPENAGGTADFDWFRVE